MISSINTIHLLSPLSRHDMAGHHKKITGRRFGFKRSPVSKPRNLETSRERDADDSSPISRLPGEIILQILNKVIDLKTLCCCYLVSRRFSSIVLQVDTITYSVPLLNTPVPNRNTFRDVKKLLRVLIKPLHRLRRMIVASGRPSPPFISTFCGESFRSALMFLMKFKRVKSLCIELPSLSRIDSRCKWKVKFGHRIESFIFLSPISICDNDGDGVEDHQELINDMLEQNCDILFQCLMDATVRHMILLYFVKNLPMLEEVSIIDSGRRGRLSLSGEKLSEVKEYLHPASKSMMGRVEVPDIASQCCIPVLKLPVSGYVMKGIYFGVMEMKDFQGGYDGLIDREDGFEDKEEAAYSEAVMEILEKHRGRMERIL